MIHEVIVVFMQIAAEEVEPYSMVEVWIDRACVNGKRIEFDKGYYDYRVFWFTFKEPTVVIEDLPPIDKFIYSWRNYTFIGEKDGKVIWDVDYFPGMPDLSWGHNNAAFRKKWRDDLGNYRIEIEHRFLITTGDDELPSWESSKNM